MTFNETLNLIIDYHIEETIDSSDPYAHRPPAGRTASIVRLMTDRELSLTTYEFDAVVQVADSDELWEAINANLEYVLWRTPTMYNMDCERLLARGVIPKNAQAIELQERVA
jgi:hypothetical protein